MASASPKGPIPRLKLLVPCPASVDLGKRSREVIYET